MLIRKNKKTNRFIKWLLLTVTAFLIILTIIIAIGASMHYFYKNKILFGMYIANQHVGGKTTNEAKKLLQTVIDEYKQAGLNYVYQTNLLNLQTSITSTDLDNYYELINFYLDESLDQAWAIGHNQGYSQNFLQQIKHLTWPRHYGLITEINDEQIINLLKNHYAEYETIANSTVPRINNQNQIEIISHSLGMNFDYQTIIQATKNSAMWLDNNPISLNLDLSWPKVLKTEIDKSHLTQLQNLLQENKTLILTYQTRSWLLYQSQYKDWLIFEKKAGQIQLALAEKKLQKYLEDNLATIIDQDSLNAKFSIINGRVKEFQNSRDGQELNIPATIEIINNNFFTNEENSFELVVAKLSAKITVADTNNIGITEIIGVGKSNFAGSPSNRIHNIKTGANSLNGLIIKPDEIFSLITALGKIDSEHGYLPELVIKGNETVAEYGGGLCQIGTTVFRVAIDTGLPIIERRNHSYRVSYYEPAGFDATIYNPKPDMRFTNNTGNNILIQTRIEGTELIFEYWGTTDGRLVEYTEPRIYNITRPGPTKLIETTNLKPGEKKCTERPHNGADADFDYKVTYANGEIIEENFFSHYVAWPEVCLIGVEPKKEESKEENLEK